MIADPAIATAADYADALLTARRAKNVLTLILLLALLLQLAIFFIARYTTLITPPMISVTTSITAAPTTVPAVANQPNRYDLFHYLLGGSIFLGLVCTIMLAVVLLLIVKIMLVGRLIGVARVTSAFVWTLLLLLLLFPWQAFLRNADFTSREFMIPGVLYTWDELRVRVIGAGTSSLPLDQLILFWARFAAWPVVALVLLLVIHARSNRGMRQALGEDVLRDDTVPAA